MKRHFILLKAFTLAEVLITLGIIGVVASLTIPTLIQNTQKQEYVTQLKKDYTIFSQALESLGNDTGCPNDMICTGLFATGATAQTIGDAIISYIKVVKNCQQNLNQGCFSNSVSPYYDGSGTRTNYDANPSYKFITADGSSIMVADYADGCTTNFGSGTLSQICGAVFIDVNGLKGPNNIGRDLFNFVITSRGTLYPNGGGFLQNPPGTSQYWKDLGACQPATSGSLSGWYCTGRVMDEGWQMNY